MSEIKDRLDSLTSKFNDEAFLSNKGLSNEVGIHIFCYEPSEELLVNHYVEKLKAMNNLKANIIEYDLYEIFLEKNSLNSVPKIIYG